MRPILAVASLTFRESVRRRAFRVMAPFAAFLLASSAFFPSLDPAGQVRLVEGWALRATTLFGILLVVFLASLSLPQDIEEKRVFMLITKPLSRPALYAGKWLGFAALLAVFLGVMGLVTYGYVRLIASRGGEAAGKALVLRERLEAPAVGVFQGGTREAEFPAGKPAQVWMAGPEQDFVAWHFKGVTFGPDPAGCTARTVRVTIRVHLRRGTGKQRVGVMAYTRLANAKQLLPAIMDTVSDSGAIQFDVPTREFFKDDGDMRVVVFVPPEHRKCDLGGGPPDAVAVLRNDYADGTVEQEYTWTAWSTVVGSGFTKNQVQQEAEVIHNQRLDLYTLTVHRSPPLVARWEFAGLDPSDFSREASIEVRLPVKGQLQRKYGYVELVVRRDGEELDRRRVRLMTNSPFVLPLDPSWVAAGRTLSVDVERTDGETILAVVPEGVAIRTRVVPFAWGFLSALVLLWLELLLLLAIVLPCSTWLSGPVSLFLGIALFVMGLAIESNQENMIHLDSAIRASEVLESGEEGHGHGAGPEVPVWSLKASRFLLRNVVLRVFPELSRFEGGELLLAGVMIPASRVWGAAGYVLAYTAVTSILAMLILHFREFR